MNIIKEQKILVIFLVAFVLRLTVFLLFRPWDIQVVQTSIIINDARQYHTLANCIVDHFTFCGNTFRTPGYPFFIAVFYALFGVKAWVVLFAQIFVDLIKIYYVLKIGEMLFSRRVGLIAAIFLAIDPNSIVLTTSLLSDTLFAMLLSVSLYFYLRGLRLWEGRDFLIAGGLLALSVFVRPVAQYYFLILLVFTLLWPAKNMIVKAKYGLLYALAFAITISPWLYRNYTLYDTIKFSSIQGENLLFWQVAYTKAWETKKPGDTIIAEFMEEAKNLGYSQDGNPFRNEAIAQNIAVQYIETHPKLYLSRLISGAIHTYANLNTANVSIHLGLQPTMLPPDAMFSSESQSKLMVTFFQSKSTPEIIAGLIILALLLTNYATCFLGAYVMFQRQQMVLLAMFILSMAYFTVTGGPIGLARFRLPITPFYILIGAVFIDALLNRQALRSGSPHA